MRALHTFVAVIGIAVAGSAAWWYQNRSSAPVAKTASAAGAAAGTAASAPGEGGEAGGPPSVEVGRVEVLSIADDAQAIGSLRARQGVMLRPEVSGRIASLNFRDGQAVKSGQLLVQLDDTLQQAQLKQAQAQAAIARTQLQRSRELLSQGFVSQSAVDQNGATLEVAAAQVALAQAQVMRMRIVAPFSGIAGIRLVNLGDYVKDGADLVNVDDLGAVWADFRLPERFSARVRNGQAVEVMIDALPGKTFAGRVEALDSQVDANGRSVLVRSFVDNAAGLLKPGMFARTRIVFAQRDKAVVVPEEALVPQGGRQYLMKVLPGKGGAMMSHRLEARLGVRLAGKVEILEGLVAGDTVVTAGQSRLMRGEPMPVRVVDLSRESSRPTREGARDAGGAGGAGPAGGAGNGAGVPGNAASAAPAV